MMNILARSLIIPMALLLTGCATALAPREKACSFTYNQDVIDRFVVPTLKAKYGSNYTIWSLEKPGILKKGDAVELILGQDNIAIIDTPDFIITVDRCATKVINAEEVSPIG